MGRDDHIRSKTTAGRGASDFGTRASIAARGLLRWVGLQPDRKDAAFPLWVGLQPDGIRADATQR
ncbi:MAG TPA: hypothetical protein PLM09_18635, partial [Casimicrobiaceae bacterium]|nr:hypothetical protein [Casimicrobiaceae bacterium]